jgi:hypothetical protein
MRAATCRHQFTNTWPPQQRALPVSNKSPTCLQHAFNLRQACLHPFCIYPASILSPAGLNPVSCLHSLSNMAPFCFQPVRSGLKPFTNLSPAPVLNLYTNCLHPPVSNLSLSCLHHVSNLGPTSHQPVSNLSLNCLQLFSCLS